MYADIFPCVLISITFFHSELSTSIAYCSVAWSLNCWVKFLEDKRWSAASLQLTYTHLRYVFITPTIFARFTSNRNRTAFTVEQNLEKITKVQHLFFFQSLRGKGWLWLKQYVPFLQTEDGMINNEKEIPLIKLQHLLPYSTFLEYGCLSRGYVHCIRVSLVYIMYIYQSNLQWW